MPNRRRPELVAADEGGAPVHQEGTISGPKSADSLRPNVTGNRNEAFFA